MLEDGTQISQQASGSRSSFKTFFPPPNRFILNVFQDHEKNFVLTIESFKDS